jgi:hypothetical protein
MSAAMPHWWNWSWWTTERGTALFALLAATAALLAWVATRRQLREATMATRLDGIARVIEMLQNEKMRDARRYLYLNPHDVTEDAYRGAAEDVAHTYNSIGFLVSAGLIDKKLLFENWARSIVEMWDAVLPWVTVRRTTEHDPRLWSSFAGLRDQAAAFRP